jgi:hypothetical protein
MVDRNRCDALSITGRREVTRSANPRRRCRPGRGRSLITSSGDDPDPSTGFQRAARRLRGRTTRPEIKAVTASVPQSASPRRPRPRPPEPKRPPRLHRLGSRSRTRRGHGHPNPTRSRSPNRTRHRRRVRQGKAPRRGRPEEEARARQPRSACGEHPRRALGVRRCAGDLRRESSLRSHLCAADSLEPFEHVGL